VAPAHATCEQQLVLGHHAHTRLSLLSCCWLRTRLLLLVLLLLLWLSCHLLLLLLVLPGGGSRLRGHPHLFPHTTGTASTCTCFTICQYL
jgi:hypothetical protein